MFHTPFHKVAPNLPQAGQIVNDPAEPKWVPAVAIYTGPDALVANHGSIFTITPQSKDAKVWLGENLRDAQTFGIGYAVEARYIADIVAGMDEAGLEVA